MDSFVVVVSQIFSELAINFQNIVWNFVETFLLQCPVETLNVSIVVRFTDSGVAMILFDIRHKPFPEFRSMIWLEHLETKRCFSLCFRYKLDRCCCVHTSVCTSKCPPRVHINEHKHIQSFLFTDHAVNGINLNQIAWFTGIWTILVGMISLPRAPFLDEMFSVQGSLHRREWNSHSIIFQFPVHCFRVPVVFQSFLYNFLNNIFFQLFWMMKWSRAFRWYGMVTKYSCFPNPVHDRRMVKPQMSAYLPGAPAAMEKPGCFSPYSRHVFVVCVHTLDDIASSGAKLLNLYVLFDKITPKE